MKRTVVVLAGGLGTRVAHLTGSDGPKAMLPVAGHPFIDYKLAQLVAAGAEEIVLLVGHGADALSSHVGTSAFGVPIRLVRDGPVLLGTGGAIRRIVDSLPPQFWVTYGDTLVEVPFEAAERWAREVSRSAVMSVLRNDDRGERSNVAIGDDQTVITYDKQAAPGICRYIDYGMLYLPAEAFTGPVDQPVDLGEIVGRLVADHQLGAWVVTEPFHDIGTESALRATEEWARTTDLWEQLMERIPGREPSRDLP